MVNIKVKETKNEFEKIQGLIGVSKPYPLLLKTRFGIHTFGVRRPIDVVVVSEQQEVVKIKQNLSPNRIFLWPVKYDTVIELPTGTIVKLGLKLGSQVKIEVE